MKYCPNCGMENPDTGLFCMGCGERFAQEAAGVVVPSPSSSSPAYQPISPSSKAYYQLVNEKYSQLIFHANYQRLVTGSLVFALGPVVSFALGFFLAPEDLSSILLSTLVNLVCFVFFIYGIHSFSQLEPRSLNDQISSVPIYFAIYAIVGIVTSLLSSAVPAITVDMSLDELREIANQIILILILEAAASVFLLLGALKFTNWFKDLVSMLQAPYNAPTNRIKWFATFTLIGTGMLMVAYFLLIFAIDSRSDAIVDNAMAISSFAILVLFAATILQLAGGYKVYSVLNNIRNARYTPPSQQNFQYK